MGYTFGMKIAISLPDDLFEEAEKLARRLNVSRSRLYREALAEYVGRHDPDEITTALNRACDALGHVPDPAAAAAARRILEASEW